MVSEEHSSLQCIAKLTPLPEINFGFREPYQVLCDSQFLEAAIRSKMDIDHILKATLHGSTKLCASIFSFRLAGAILIHLRSNNSVLDEMVVCKKG